MGTYLFYAVTGYVYSLLLFVGIGLSSMLPWQVTVKAAIVAAIWAVIRVIDRSVVPRIDGLMARILLE